jgi:hydrogenase nickel incorporation protein HypB
MIRKIVLGRSVLEDNQRVAQKNRLFFEKNHILALNIVASPGAGKTTFLLRTIAALKNKVPIFAIEADPGRKTDTERLAQHGIAVCSVGTSLCHLEARDIEKALDELPLVPFSILFIENVGNLVCPAEYDLGQAHTILLLASTDGEDKPLKYPPLVRKSHLALLTKMDVADACGFQWQKAKEALKIVNPLIEVLAVSAKTGQGFDDWFLWLMQEKEKWTDVSWHPDEGDLP